MNWRKHTITGLLALSGSKVIPHYKEILQWRQYNRETILSKQQVLLKDLLLYSYKHVPYYNTILPKAGVIDSKKNVCLENFSNIPPLSKDILRDHSDELLSDEHAKLKPYSNHSGGSTGEPTHFEQSKDYSDWNIANKIYISHDLGKQLGEREMKIWGSDRDLLEGTMGISAKIQNWIYNRDFENSFYLTDQRRKEIVKALQTRKPKLIWGYIDSLFEMSEYILENDISIPAPAAVICGAGTVYPHMQKAISEAFGAPAINSYGGREAGSIACECLQQDGVHVYHHTHVIETIDDAGNPVTEEDGEILVTTLRNKVMPLIRYQVGDRGTLSHKTCACGWETDVFKEISGRVMQCIYNERGDSIPPEFFIHIIGVTFNKGQIHKFQIRQNSVHELTISIVLKAGSGDSMDPQLEQDITSTIRKVMNGKVDIAFEYVEDIPKTPSGKYLYIIGKMKEELFEQ